MKLAIEGDLNVIAQEEFKSFHNLSVVIGTDCTPMHYKNPYKQLFSLMNTNIRPVYIIEDDITLIERSKIIVISEIGKEIPQRFKKFLNTISEKDQISIQYCSDKNKNEVLFSKVSEASF